jgi:hypothetical protein
MHVCFLHCIDTVTYNNRHTNSIRGKGERESKKLSKLLTLYDEIAPSKTYAGHKLHI